MNKRNIVVALLLTFVTCGIYGVYWYLKLDSELCEASGDWSGQHGIVLLLLNLVTCGIWGFIWSYQAGKKMDTLENNTTNNTVVFILLALFGLGIVNWCIIQNKLNSMA